MTGASDLDYFTMKKTTHFVTVILLVCRTGDCQWYQKYYGASDRSILSQIQLDMALICVPAEILGLFVMGKNRLRMSEIGKFINNTELNIELKCA